MSRGNPGHARHEPRWLAFTDIPWRDEQFGEGAGENIMLRDYGLYMFYNRQPKYNNLEWSIAKTYYSIIPQHLPNIHKRGMNCEENKV